MQTLVVAASLGDRLGKASTSWPALRAVQGVVPWWVSAEALFNFMAAITICSDFGAPKIKSATISTVSPSISHEVMGPDAMIFIF